jgi:hypothetical protein
MQRLGKLPNPFQPHPDLQRPEKAISQKRCALCEYAQDRKTKTICGRCSNHVCSQHYHILCDNCLNLNVEEENEEVQEADESSSEEENME